MAMPRAEIEIDLFLSTRRVYEGDRLVAICDDWNYVARRAETYVGLNMLTHVVEPRDTPTHRALVPAGYALPPEADDLVRDGLRKIRGVTIWPVNATPLHSPPPPPGSLNDGGLDHDEDEDDQDLAGECEAVEFHEHGRQVADGDEDQNAGHDVDRPGYPDKDECIGVAFSGSHDPAVDEDEDAEQKAGHLPFRLAGS